MLRLSIGGYVGPLQLTAIAGLNILLIPVLHIYRSGITSLAHVLA